MTEITLTVAEACARAAAALEAGDLAQAQRLCEAVLGADPRHVDALSLLGSVKFRQGSFAEALALADRFLAVVPGSPVALGNRGSALAAMNRRKAALASFDEAVRVHPDEATPFLARLLLNRGTLLMQLTRDPEALRDIERALAITADNIDARKRRGIVLRRLKRPREALGDFGQVLAVDNRDFDALRHRAEILLELKQYRDACQSFDQALAIRQQSFEIHRGRGIALCHLGELAQASASLDQALALRGGEGRAPTVVPARGTPSCKRDGDAVAGTHNPQPIERTR